MACYLPVRKSDSIGCYLIQNSGQPLSPGELSVSIEIRLFSRGREKEGVVQRNAMCKGYCCQSLSGEVFEGSPRWQVALIELVIAQKIYQIARYTLKVIVTCFTICPSTLVPVLSNIVRGGCRWLGCHCYKFVIMFLYFCEHIVFNLKSALP